jgi:hypothetical protein
MEIEQVWGETARDCEGKKVANVELIPICQMLRLVFENDNMIELSSCWRYRTSKTILKGSLDIGFYMQAVESKEELEEFEKLIDEDEEFHLKKLSTLVGRTLKKIDFTADGVSMEFSGKRYLDWFCLSAIELGFRALDEYSQR